MQVSLEDAAYVRTRARIERIIERNLATVAESLTIYNKYAFILQEKEKATRFVDSRPKREEYTKQIRRYQELYREVHENLPFFITLNMVRVDAVEVKKRLLAQV
jgi:hypothetical protein